MTKVEAAGLVASLIALFEAGYVIGVWRTRRQRKSAEDELIANRLRQVLGSVRIRKLKCESLRVAPGQTVPIIMTIASEVACALEVWIGASLVHHSGSEHYDTSQDKPVRLEPGTKTYQRSLTVPSNVAHGDYSLVAAVWLGQVANPEHSIQLDTFQQEEIVKVRGK
jgi:hypothetical protein